ncbi:hypothetical protein [Rathayibacter sp. VKM Ac-2857]|uniref:hypothetical protein n=1 Tax=Rathayibacter sp. VKM Ac-2857 TaxID=2739020 RepID=UPI0015662296|nr:hypothetical protein [Rathayibacter sp. VKM Ac-2857]NQX17291.1 hypothetical protein [Rathayibacter sp. VKM Ac-2857]
MVKGQHVRLVRYLNTPDGWTYEVVHGQLEQRTTSGWHVWVVDELRELPETEWSLYRP